MTTDFKIIGFTDSVNECDCCGKTNLKGTYCINIDGIEFYYGSTCAKRNTGLSAAAFGAKERQDRKNLILAFSLEFAPINREYTAKLQALDFSTEEWGSLNKELTAIELDLKAKHGLIK